MNKLKFFNYQFSNSNSKTAFTLAEVLITLGIIGVIAALTIPTLIQNHRTKVVETKLKKVYSVMNQAILRSEIDNGKKEDWDFSDDNFWDRYFAPYIYGSKTEEATIGNTNYLKVYFNDGSMLITKRYIGGGGNTKNKDWFFVPNIKSFNEANFSSRSDGGKAIFMFLFDPNSSFPFHKNKGFEPYSAYIQLDNLDDVWSGNSTFSCNKDASTHAYCTFAIARNGWEIPKNYPFKVR